MLNLITVHQVNDLICVVALQQLHQPLEAQQYFRFKFRAPDVISWLPSLVYLIAELGRSGAFLCIVDNSTEIGIKDGARAKLLAAATRLHFLTARIYLVSCHPNCANHSHCGTDERAGKGPNFV